MVRKVLYTEYFLLGYDAVLGKAKHCRKFQRLQFQNFFNRATRRHIPEENTLQNHRCENLKSYILYTEYNT
jgi:hypothetical protein